MPMRYGCGCATCQAIAAAWRDTYSGSSPTGVAVSSETLSENWSTEKVARRAVIDGCVLDPVTGANTDVRHALTPKAPDPATHDATVTLPYGFTLPIPSASEKKQDELKEAEDQILSSIGEWPRWKLALAYRYINARGIRLDQVDELVRKRTA